MINSLFQRLMIAMLLPACILVLALATYFSMAGLDSMEAQLFQHGQDIVRYIAPSSEYGLVSGNRQSLQSMVQVAMEQRDVRGAAIFSLDGQISAISGRLSLDTATHRMPPAGPRKIAQGNGWVAFAAPVQRTVTDEDSLFLVYSNPKSRQEPEVIGQVILELDTSQLAAKQKELVLQGLGILIPALLFFALLTARMARTLILPILHLAKAAKSIAEGHTDARVPETSKDEIGYLERGFNQMANQVSEVHRTLQQRIDEATAQLAYQARHDPLTGLINRREFETRLKSALDVTQAGGAVCSVLFIDLDHFKKVNDLAGHIAGDELLRRISKQLQNRIRDTDTIARLGGDEFAVLLNDCASEHARVLGDALCSLVATYHFHWEDKVFTIGASIGLVEVDTSYQNVVDVLAAGDAACYAAKAAGKNRVEHFRPSDVDGRKIRDVAGREILENAITNDSVCYETMHLHATEPGASNLVELLGYLQESPEDTPIPLLLMMDMAERCELAHVFDQRLLRRAAAALDTGSIALIRIAGASAHHPEFLTQLETTLAQLGPSASHVCLLVSEETAINFPRDVELLAARLRAFGGKIGLDDFGGWRGSFAHLERIQPAYVRIATTLTRDIHHQRSAVAVVKAIQEIAHEHCFQTIATGIDNEADYSCLENLGINHLQANTSLQRQ